MICDCENSSQSRNVKNCKN